MAYGNSVSASGGTFSRLAALRAKLRAREHIPGYRENCDAIRAEIARLEEAGGEPE